MFRIIKQCNHRLHSNLFKMYPYTVNNRLNRSNQLMPL